MDKKFNGVLSLRVDMGYNQKRHVQPVRYADGLLTVKSPASVSVSYELYLGIAYMGKLVGARIMLDQKQGIETLRPIGNISDVSFEKIGAKKFMVCTVKISDELRPLFEKASNI